MWTLFYNTINPSLFGDYSRTQVTNLQFNNQNYNTIFVQEGLGGDSFTTQLSHVSFSNIGRLLRETGTRSSQNKEEKFDSVR